MTTANQEKVENLMKLTGKGRMACEIPLSLAGGDVEKTLERMKKTYPQMVLKSNFK